MAPIAPFEWTMTESTPAPILLLLHVFNLAMTFICSINRGTERLNRARFKPIPEVNFNNVTMLTMEEKQMALHAASKTGNLSAVQELLRCGTYHSVSDKEGYTPLHWAAAKGHVDIARLLLDSGARFEERGGKKFFFTPLHMAAGEGRLELTKLLLDRGARVSSTDKYRDTALHWAAWFGHLPVVQFLIQRGADVKAQNADGHTAQDMAILRRHHHVIDWLQQQ